MSAVAPGPRGVPFFGNALAFRRDPLKFLTAASREFGGVVKFRLGAFDVHLLNEPELIKDVFITYNRSVVQGRGHQRARGMLGNGLLTSEGDFHTRQRRLAQPAFHRQRIAGYAEVMADRAEQASARWRDGDTVDANDEMMRLTLAIAATTLFGADVDDEAVEIGEAISTFMDWWRMVMLPYAELIDRIPLPVTRRFERARARLDTTIYRIIEERRASGEDHGDLLSMLLMATDTEGDGTGMTDEQLRDECVTLLIAGHETTANALTWTWHLLSQHPEYEAKLHEELDRVLGDRAPSMDDVPRLVYTERVLTESMRLYPPAWGIGRRIVQEIPLGSYRFPAGSLVFISPYVTQRDERFFENAARFDPDRWTPEMKASLPRFAYFPFGGGPRQCIGEPFAWMEGVLVLAAIARRWRLRLVEGQQIVPHPSITLRPRYGVKMMLERR